MVREKTNEKTADISARSFMDTPLRQIGKECQAEGEAKNGRMKSFSSITHENCEGSISSTRRTRNLRKPSRMLARNWKPVAPAMPCKIIKNCGSGGSNKNITKLACILEADESTRMCMGNSIPSNHEDH